MGRSSPHSKVTGDGGNQTRNLGDTQMSFRFFAYPFLALMLAATGVAEGQTSDAAQAAFKKLDDYLQNNPMDFETKFNATSDGNELYHGTGHFILRQPTALRADISLNANTYVVISDGTVLTIYDPQQKKYSQNAAPGSLSAAFGFFAGELGIDSQVLNFMGVVHEAVSGNDGTTIKAAGNESVDGKSCDKFTVTGASGDDTWQVWMEQGDKPRFCKLVYHSVDGPAQTNMFHWNAAPKISPDTFTFTAPAGSTKVDVGDLNMVSP